MSKFPRIDFYFDVISPYAYIGFEAIQQLSKQWGNVRINYIPFYLGAVMKASGNQPPALLPNRSKMMYKDLLRTAKYWNVPLTHPPKFMEWIFKYNTVDALRLLIVLGEQNEKLKEKAAREMWLRLWSQNEKIFEHDDLVQILQSLNVKNIDEILGKIRETRIVEQLNANTKEVIEQYGYGAPWIRVHSQDGKSHTFFGSDRFHLIADLLNLSPPIPERLSKI